jgi:hypothetical protein
VAYELAHGTSDADGRCVLHYCDNPPCVNPDHLWIGDYADNNHDRQVKGRTRNQHTGRIGRPDGLAESLHLGGNGLVPRVAAEALAQLAARAGWGRKVTP